MEKTHIKRVLFACIYSFSLVSLPLCAQTAAVSAGGSNSTSAGFISVSLGQTACLYASSGNHYDGQGVQQPYGQTQNPCQPCYDTLHASVCQHTPYVAGEFNLPSDSTAMVGTLHFTHRHVSADGCDSLVTLVLTVHPVVNSVTHTTACDSLWWRDTLLIASGTYTRHALSVHGCDSMITLHLSLHSATVSYERQQVEAQYQWHGRTLTASGIYRDTLYGSNAAGCDSVVQLSLAVIGNFDIPVIYCFSRRLIMVDHYPGGEGIPRVDYYAYRWYHNDDLLPLATSDNYFNLFHDRYVELGGCYYVEVPIDAARTVWVRSNVLCITGSDDDLRSPALELYPNPSPARGTVAAVVSDSPSGSRLLLHDAYGRLIHSIPVTDGTNYISVNLTAGTYTVSLRSPQGAAEIRKLVVR